MFVDRRVHVARWYISSADSPFSLKSSLTLSNHLLFGIPLFLSPCTCHFHRPPSFVSFTQFVPLAGSCLCPLCHCGQVVSRTYTSSSRRQEVGHRLWLPAVAIHRLGVVEIAPFPHHCFRTAHQCAQSVMGSPTEPVLSRSSRQRIMLMPLQPPFQLRFPHFRSPLYSFISYLVHFVTPHIHPSIRNSATSDFISCAFFNAHVSVSCTTVLYTFAFIVTFMFLSRNTLTNTLFQFFHPLCTLLVTSASSYPSFANVEVCECLYSLYCLSV